MKRISEFLGVVGLAAILPGVAQAQLASDTGGIADIVVTAQKRAESLQATPIAISAFTGEMLADYGITSVADVVAVSPSLYSAPHPNSPTALQLYMRGQGTNNPMQITKDGAVGLYLDGFYLARPQSATMDMADIERVEVLRGPQGTLYGRNTTGGAVNIITKKPTGELQLRQTLALGNRSHVRSLTNVDLPQIGPLALKGTLLYSNTDGWVHNPGPGADYGFRRQLAGQAQARLSIGENLTADYSFDKGRIDSTPSYFWNRSVVDFVPDYVVRRTRAHRAIDLEKSRIDFEGHLLTVEWEPSEAITLRSLSGYRHFKADQVQYYADAYSTPGNGTLMSITPYEQIATRQYSQELQAVGSIGDRLDYVGGLYYFRETGDHHYDVHIYLGTLAGPTGTSRTIRDIDMVAKSRAAYAQLTYTPPLLDDRLELTAGARYTKDSRRSARDQYSSYILPGGPAFPTASDEIGVRNQLEFSKFNPAATINFRASSELTIYAKYSSGYRAGGSDESALFFTETFGPESVSNFELGLKSDLFDRRARINLAAFMMNYRDIQMDMPVLRNNPSVNQTINAGKARISGIEADVVVQPFSQLTLTANYAYLHTKVQEVVARPGSVLDPVVNPDSGFALSENIASRFVLAFAPRHAFTIAADYTFVDDGGVKGAAHLNYQWKDRAYSSSPAGRDIIGRENWAIPSYGTLDGRLNFTFDQPDGTQIGVAFWGRNILDKDYLATVNATGSPATGFVSQNFAYGEPATYGVEVRFRF